MSERDELAEVIRGIDGPATLGGLEVADAILDAGYRKPRVVHEDYAMEAVDAVLEQYYRTQLSAVDALNQIAAINGAYKMGQVGK